MPSSYSTNLKIELQATGENSGTWGTITNTNLGTALEQAVVGYGNPSYPSDANLTLTYTDTNAAQAARALVLNVTSAVSLSTTRELVVPTIQKQYIVQNNTTGGQSITVKTSAGTGITVPNGRKAHLYVNGTDVIYMDDFVDINGGTIDGTTIGGSSAAAGTFTTLTASSIATFAAGSAAAPSITTTGDTNTGIFFPAADTIAFTEGGVEAARFDSSGNLTFSSTAQRITADMSNATVSNRFAFQNSVANAQSIVNFLPNGTGTVSQLQLFNNSTPTNGSFAGLFVNASESRLQSGTQGSGTYLPLTFFTNGSEQARLDTSGNLGLGTTAPSNTAGFSRQLQIEGTTAALTLSGTTGTGKYTLGVPGANAVGLWDNTASAYRWYVDSSGNLGIGTTTLQGKLTVQGDIYTRGGGVYYVQNNDNTNNYYLQNGGATGAANGNLNFVQGGVAVRAILDSSGNLGLGVTPSAWSSDRKNIQIGSGASFQGSASAPSFTEWGANFYTNSSVADIYIGNDYATKYRQYLGAHQWYTAPSGTAGNAISFTQAMTLDASGNLGVGTTTPQFRTDIINNSTYQLRLATGTGQDYVNGGLYLGAFGTSDPYYYGYMRWDQTDICLKIGSQHGNSTGGILFLTGIGSGAQTERARITCDGKFLVGATATASVLNKTIELSSAGTSTNQPSYLVNSYVAAGNAVNCGYFTFNRSAGSTVGTNTLVANDDRLGMVRFSGANGTSYNAAAEIYAEIDGTPGASSDMPGRLIFATTANGAGSTTERARITSGGDLLVGTTAARAGELVSITKNMTTNWLLETVNTATSGNIFGNLVLFTGQSPNNATSKFMAGSDNTTERFALRSNGGLANYQANDANLSDERVKTDIKPLGSYWDKFKAIEIVAFKYKDQTHDDDNIGVIAQQVESVAPEFVDADGWGETPEDGLPLKTVYTTDMYHAAIKALQEAMTRIEQLEAKFAALETK
jgi:hypothetical protein